MKIACYTLLLGLVMCFSETAHPIDLVINPDVAQESLSRNTLRSIFSMRKTQWSDGTPIHVFVMGDKNELHQRFTKQLLGLFPHQLRRVWNRQIYSGMGQAPIKVESETEMREHVANTPGAIGYLSKESFNEQVRAIEIDN